MNIINTKFGTLKGITHAHYYQDGSIKDCILTEPTQLQTPYGTLIPQYEDDGIRRKQIKALSFYQNGNLKNFPLQHKVDISTSIGIYPAEMMTFYDNGSIRRLFPLDGKLSGFWSEEDECQLAEEFQFNFSFGAFKKKVIGLQFYETGAVKSLTFWPKDRVTIQTPIGEAEVRIGISLYSDGKLKSFEPSKAVEVSTLIGKIMAYDVKAIGVHGESNSLKFSEDGIVERVVTTTSVVHVVDENGLKRSYQPGTEPGIFNPTTMELIPLIIEFHSNKVRFNNSSTDEFNIEDCNFTVEPYSFKLAKSCSSCSDCSACG